MPWSKSQKLAWQREYRKKHRQIINAARRTKYAASRGKEQEYQRRWRLAHPDKVSAQNVIANAKRRAAYPRRRQEIQEKIRKWRAENPHKIREYNQRSYYKNRDKIIHSAARSQDKRRAIKIGAPLGDVYVIERWQKSIRSMKWVRCHWCGTKVNGKRVHFDHVRPLSKGGAHSIENICASCPDCNYHKSARLIADWIVGDQAFLSF